MFKALLLLDCDWCRTLFPHSRTVALDTTAWRVHGQHLEALAEHAGWLVFNSMEQQICPDCADQYCKELEQQATLA